MHLKINYLFYIIKNINWFVFFNIIKNFKYLIMKIIQIIKIQQNFHVLKIFLRFKHLYLKNI